MTSVFVANSSIFPPPLFFYALIEKSCHLSHCCSQQQGQVEESVLEEQFKLRRFETKEAI